MELDRFLWNEDRGWTIQLKQLWTYLAQYCYLPRLFDQAVLVKAIQEGVGRSDAPFAFATGTNPQGYHTGLLYRLSGDDVPVAQIYFDEQSLLIHPDHINPPPPEPPKITEQANAYQTEARSASPTAQSSQAAPASPEAASQQRQVVIFWKCLGMTSM